MKKDIEIPIAKEVFVAPVHEWNDDFLSKDWNAYVINNRNTPIDMVLIVSKGFDKDKKTSTMRHGIGLVGAKSFEKIELVQEDVLQLDNEFFVTFFADDKLYERRFIFEKNTVNEQNLVHIPIIEKEGVLAK
ncbi:hypothetical protein [Sediminicola sp. 1XM1-17]|uniref:hypothetical protein n=1 Tax=Sediminicola sp. 1XM1-17 TaxID=3127702 RepID=UPI003077B936